ncbi:Silver-binding protein silE precursor [Serratia grimesii]|uniref:copper resistance protein n=1 Tax=Serratia grimesii TaxID=82995 RepID=UPI0021770B1D|nr:copper resistance protein [Serratia grimesii]CAI1781678.1 Silver-binding protein silE precursor [Serratia grimesii]
MNRIILITVLSTLSIGTSFANTSEQALNAHKFVNNASAVSHVNASVHKEVNKSRAKSFSEMNEHERAIVAHSFMNNSNSYAHQKIIESHKKMLAQEENKPDPVSYSDLNAADRAALVHEQVNNAAAPAHQMQAEKIRAAYAE